MILSNPDFEDIISWLPHGRSWRILQQKAFEERVIPLYFRHGRYSSFARQVNGWGFRRVTHGSDYNSYYHELFLRGLPHLCDKMRRLTSKDVQQQKKATAEEDSTPDFYTISKDNPLPESNQTPLSKKIEDETAIQRGRLEHLHPTSSPLARSVSLGTSQQKSSLPAGGQQQQAIADAELALLERRRADILDRINSLSVARRLQSSGSSSVAGGGFGGFQDMSPLLAAYLPQSYAAAPGSFLGRHPTTAAQLEMELLLQRRTEARMLVAASAAAANYMSSGQDPKLGGIGDASMQHLR